MLEDDIRHQHARLRHRRPGPWQARPAAPARRDRPLSAGVLGALSRLRVPRVATAAAFEGYSRLLLGAAAVLMAGTLWRAWLFQRGLVESEVSRTEWFLLGTMLLLAGVITFVLHPQAAALQAQAFAIKSEEPRKAAFEAFFQLHKPMRVLYILNIGLGIALLAERVRSWNLVKE